MYFQIVDSNKKCEKVFSDGKVRDYIPDDKFKKTWKYSSHLRSTPEQFDYAYLMCEGDMQNICPRFYEDTWTKHFRKISSILKSVKISMCDLENSCIYDYIPDKFLYDFLTSRDLIIKNAFENFAKPNHYEILRKAHVLTEEMNSRLNLYKGEQKRTNYNIFGTKTGRLSNPKSSLPILTMKKEDRVFLEPSNDLFVEFDFNAAELRTLLALSGKEQPQIDIHDWNLQQAKENLSREEMKKRTFAWLYNPGASDGLLERLYDRSNVMGSNWDGSRVKTPFLRFFETDERRSLNYLLQSTSSDICIEQSYKLREFFKNSNTKICYLLHDSVILDFDKNDVSKFLQAKEIFSNTRLGKYLVNASIGKNFGQMKEV